MRKLIFFAIISLLSSGLLAKDTSSKTAEIWKRFTGTNYCEKRYCADGIPSEPLKEALDYFKNNQHQIDNTSYIGIIDMRMASVEKRFFILNLKNGSVESLLVTHGKKSETENAFAGRFSNTIGSEMSSIGFYVTDDQPYSGKHGTSLRLNGMSVTNSNALDRGIVLHAADYATDEFIKIRGRLGLSQGCPAVAPDKINRVISKLKGRALLFIYSDIK